MVDWNHCGLFLTQELCLDVHRLALSRIMALLRAVNWVFEISVEEIVVVGL